MEKREEKKKQLQEERQRTGKDETRGKEKNRKRKRRKKEEEEEKRKEGERRREEEKRKQEEEKERKRRRNHCIYEKEAYAVIWGLAACKSYIIDNPRPILVLTDNKAPTWIKKKATILHDRIGRWQAELNRYDTYVRHRPAIQNRHSDGLEEPSDWHYVVRIAT